MSDTHCKSPLKNWLVSAWLASPIAGDPPELDGILAWEMSLRLGLKHAGKTGRWTPAEEIRDVPIGLAKRTYAGCDMFCCSAPILPPLDAPEWTDHTGKRFESSKLAAAIAPEYRKSVMTASGPYKSRFVPVRVRLVPRVCWFIRGNREEVNKILKSVHSIGLHRAIGYGAVWKWTFDEVEKDYSIFAPHNGKIVLMKALPLPGRMGARGNFTIDAPYLENVCGYRVSYGGYRPPYWHPSFQRAVAEPC